MPYIKQNKRVEIEKLINSILHYFEQSNSDTSYDGEMNYVITKLLLALYHDRSYQAYNRAIGVLECVKQEFYRRKVTPYEEEKRNSVGDVY